MKGRGKGQNGVWGKPQEAQCGVWREPSTSLYLAQPLEVGCPGERNPWVRWLSVVWVDPEGARK